MPSPNVLCVSIDSLRLDNCSLYAPQRQTTPTIDTIGRDGIRFDSAISPSTWTFPVHASLFTGLYPLEHGLRDHGDSLGAHPTFAELLSKEGYETRSFGYNVWLERGEVLRGFDHTSTTEIEEGEGIFEKMSSEMQRKLFRTTFLDKRTVRTAKRTIDPDNEPFCAFVHLQGVHNKYRPYPTYARRFSDGSTLDLVRTWYQQRRLYAEKRNRFLGKWRPEEDTIDGIRDLYAACVRHADDRIGELLEWLKNAGILENTVVIVFSDHGDCFGEDGIFGHQFSVADELIRVPFVVHDPTDTIPGDEREDLVQTLDLYPTILDLCGIEPPETNAVSFTEENARDHAFVQYRAASSLYENLNAASPSRSLPKEIYAVWKGKDSKLAYYPESESWSGVGDYESLRPVLDDHLNSLASVSPERGSDLEDDVEKRLREMGYL